ncbi:MAG: RDD family protein [Planctomycetes bacterium]|nr:RDD family protein [Planctomycetota bacterium]
MKTTEINNCKAGFWIRFAAVWIDLFIIFVTVRLIVFTFNRIGIYIPFELTFGLSFLIYQILLISWKGYTIGKKLCGIKVCFSKNMHLSYIRVLLRETIFKLISCVFLFLGFIWVALSQKKKAWHDYLSGTTVTQDPKLKTQSLVVSWTTVIIITFLIGLKTIAIGLLLADCQKMRPSLNSQIQYMDHKSSSLVEVSSLSEKDHAKFIEWLDINGKNPVEYIVETASNHQVTILGEVHEKKDYLLFLKKIIPELYYKAGVTCIAMEVCLAEDNEKINKLVTDPEFDHNLALKIARHQWWGIWGFKEYWDIFEVVWHLNQEIPDGRKKMRLIGIDVKCDGPSLGLVTGGEGAKIKAPIWEKLRIFRLLGNILPLVKRDELMARNVEKEIIENGERGVVWIGLNHSYTQYQQPIILNGKVVKKWTRMGALLHQKYGKEVFQVALHEYHFNPIMRNFIEPIMEKRESVPVGFDIQDSPFANLRDNRSEEYLLQPSLQFADKVSGYIYLKPWREIQKCEWLPGYVSEEMFIANKPFYKAWAKLAGRDVNNAEEVNKTLRFLLVVQP